MQQTRRTRGPWSKKKASSHKCVWPLIFHFFFCCHMGSRCIGRDEYDGPFRHFLLVLTLQAPPFPLICSSLPLGDGLGSKPTHETKNSRHDDTGDSGSSNWSRGTKKKKRPTTFLGAFHSSSKASIPSCLPPTPTRSLNHVMPCIHSHAPLLFCVFLQYCVLISHLAHFSHRSKHAISSCAP